jgi:type IV pilus assembly protein PilC
MPIYRYLARDASGQPEQADFEAPTRHDALAALRARGLTVIHLADQASGAKSPAASPLREWLRTFFSRPERVSNAQKAIFLRQLAISVNAGMPLREALESIAEDLEEPDFRRVVLDVVQRLREGRSFSEAAACHPQVFPKLFLSLLRVAEEAGSMPQTIEYLATGTERAERLARKVRGLLAYPVFIAVFFGVVCGIMTFAVVPRFQAIFATGGARLPLLTRLVFGVNRFLIDHLLVLLLAAAAGVVLVVLYARSPAGRLRLATLCLRFPGIGPCIQKFGVARFCRHFAIMIRGGVPVASAIEIASAVCGNLALERALLQARERIVRGAGIAPALGAEPLFPRLIVRMVGIGESSGKLPEVLDKVADTYEDQVEGAVIVAMSLLEPVMICFFGVVVFVLVLAVYLPVFTAAAHTQ